MSTLSQFIGGSGILLGQSIEVTGSPPFFTDGSMEFLKHGNLKSYESKYSPFATKFKRDGLIELSPVNASSMSSYFGNDLGIVYIGGSTYVHLVTQGSTSLIVNRSTNNMASFEGYSIINIDSGIKDYAYSSNAFVVAGYDGANGRFFSFNFGNPTGTWTGGVGVIAYNVVCNTSGTKWISMNNNMGLITQTNNFSVSINGMSWSSTTGSLSSGGIDFNIDGMFFCPCANAGAGGFVYFSTISSAGLKVGVSDSGNGTLNIAPASIDANFRINKSNDYGAVVYKRLVASSPSVSIVLGYNGAYVRSTNGTTWTSHNLNTSNVSNPKNASRIEYNSTTGLFYVVTGSYTNGSMDLITSSDGLTWTQSYSIFSRGNVSYTPYILQLTNCTNGKLLVVNASTGNGWINMIHDATADIQQSTPDYIGVTTDADKVIRIL